MAPHLGCAYQRGGGGGSGSALLPLDDSAPGMPATVRAHSGCRYPGAVETGTLPVLDSWSVAEQAALRAVAAKLELEVAFIPKDEIVEAVTEAYWREQVSGHGRAVSVVRPGPMVGPSHPRRPSAGV